MDERITITAVEGFGIAVRAALNAIKELQDSNFVEFYDLKDMDSELKLIESMGVHDLYFDVSRTSLLRFQVPQVSFGFRYRRYVYSPNTAKMGEEMVSNPDADFSYKWFAQSRAYPSGGEMNEGELGIFLQSLNIAFEAVKAFNKALLTFYVSDEI